ncbi:hypothetical protein D1007_59232 [Hordeum vulgare]|nr:hypothetical protein D1007_59232 [Hordeum vulgare]
MPRNNIVLTEVSELIDVESRSWDEELIRHVFWPVDAERILTIALAIGMMSDFVSWHPAKRGSFSVRSTYHEEWDLQHGRKLRRTNTHQTSSINPIWKTLWKLRIPSKVKIHVWKSLLGAIPCYGVLANRHIKTSSQCPLCTSDCESIKHLFFQCPRVLEIWRILGPSSLIQEFCTLERDGSAVLQDLLLSKSSIRSNIADVGREEIIATVVWYIWWERRQAINGEKVFEPPRYAHAITALAKNFYRARGKKPGVLLHGWAPAGAELYKLNVDACFNTDSGTGSSRVVLRDDKGTVMATLCSDIPFADDAGSAEARGLCDGLLLELGLQKLVVESDCMEFCPRKANMAANILASPLSLSLCLSPLRLSIRLSLRLSTLRLRTLHLSLRLSTLRLSLRLSPLHRCLLLDGRIPHR